MAGVSKITLVGNLGRDPETRYTPNGRMNVQFTMAVTRRRPDGSGNFQETTNWFRVTGWGRLAETLDKLTQQGALAKGKQVLVIGSFEARDYVGNDGQQRYSLDVNADEIQLLGSRGDSGGGEFGGPVGPGRSESYGSDDVSMDDVPF
jgi:single-strand DNA-binding protein